MKGQTEYRKHYQPFRTQYMKRYNAEALEAFHKTEWWLQNEAGKKAKAKDVKVEAKPEVKQLVVKK